MAGAPLSADAENELRLLRARAYSAESDIQDDPAALARLAELEAAHAAALHGVAEDLPAPAPDASRSHDPFPAERFGVAGLVAGFAAADDGPHESSVTVTGVPDTKSARAVAASLRDWLIATRSRRIGLIAGAAVAVLVIAYAAVWVVVPRPDATLRPVDALPDSQVYRLAAFAEVLEMDTSTLRAYETYRGVEPWSTEDRYGNPCLFVIEPSSDNLLGAVCTPPGAELYADIGAWPYSADHFAEGLPAGTVIRFHLNGNQVDAHVYRGPEMETESE